MLMRYTEREVVDAVGAGAFAVAGFPAPVSTGPSGRLWRSTDVERWRASNRPAPEHQKQTRPTSHRGAETRPAE